VSLKASFATAAVFGGVVLAASPASAVIEGVARSGSWLLSAGTADNGSSACVASTEGPGKYLGIKVFENSTVVTIHVAKTGWSIPQGTQARLAMRFDRAEPWFGVATGTYNENVIEAQVPLQNLTSFTNQFRAARQLVIYFPDGNEQPWTVAMNGSRAVMNNLTQCVAVMLGRKKQTQPFASSPQPYGIAPQPSSPMPSAPAPRAPIVPERTPLPTGDRI
jgi:hypothetical protein